MSRDSHEQGPVTCCRSDHGSLERHRPRHGTVLRSTWASLVLAARAERPLRIVAAECEALGAQAEPMSVDVRDEDAVSRLAARALERFGHFEVWSTTPG
jgi:NADP-dependent 3-hydroxy acid dehydrogenase YdfG